MTKNRQNFHTINGTEVQLSIVDSELNVEIRCDSITFHVERKRRIKRISLLLLAILCGILLNYAMFNSSTVRPFIIVCVVWLLFEIHRLVDLIQFGKIGDFFVRPSQSSFYGSNLSFLFIFFKNSRFVRKNRFLRFVMPSIYDQILVWPQTHLHSHRKYSRYCHQWNCLWGESMLP